MRTRQQPAFTIVELLMVIVIVGILAAITVVVFIGMQNRAKASAVAADFSSNSRVAKLITASTGDPPTTLGVLQSSTKMAISQGTYTVYSFCSSNQGYALAAETLNGDKYYSLNGAAVVQDNGIDATNACPGLGIASANRIYLGMPSVSCAAEGGTCTYAGTATIAYGSLAVGRFTAIKDVASPASCTNAFFGDPATGFVKACYILSQ